MTALMVRNSFAGRSAPKNRLLDIVFRPLSFPATVPFLRLGWSPNQVTLLSGGCALISFVSIAIGSWPALGIGAALYFVSVLLDYVDGNVARMQDTATFFGKFLDGTKDKLVYGLLPISLALAAGSRSNGIAVLDGGYWLAVGALAGFLYMTELAVGARYGRFVRQLKLDGNALAPYPPALTGIRRVLLGIFLRADRYGEIWRRYAVVFAPIILLPADLPGVALLVVGGSYFLISPCVTIKVVHQASWTMNIYRRSKNHAGPPASAKTDEDVS